LISPQRIVLASASPRRRELLMQAGLAFEVRAADIDESLHCGETATDYVRRLALEKAHAVAAREPHAVVLGADTTVVLDGNILGKPASVDEARTMLERLSGRVHQVHTGNAAVWGERTLAHIETTDVTFGPIETRELEHYLASGDSMDKAGAYGIQGYAARWIPRIDGCYFNVMGLPIAAVVELLQRLGS
jgi:septum formation protein